MIGLTQPELETMIDSSSYIFDQSAYHNIDEVRLKASLEAAGLSSTQVCCPPGPPDARQTMCTHSYSSCLHALRRPKSSVKFGQNTKPPFLPSWPRRRLARPMYASSPSPLVRHQLITLPVWCRVYAAANVCQLASSYDAGPRSA